MTVDSGDVEQRLAFFRQLQALANKIHAAHDLDEIVLDLSAELCALLGGDRLTIYALSDDGASMVSKVKTGLASFKQLKLPISAQSIAGYAALSRKMLNLLDVYDEAALRRVDPELRFQQGVDRRTGYRTQQMLVAPIIAADGALLGVLQLINNQHGGPFNATVEEGVRLLCESIAIAFARRRQGPLRERARFAAMIPEAALPRALLETAQRNALVRNVDIEDVLLDELGLKPGLVGRALADFFGVPYFAFQPERRRPPGLLDSFNLDYVMQNQWMPIEESRRGLFVLTLDPDQLKASGAVTRIFPGAVPVYCVTTRREFNAMVQQFFGSASAPAARPATGLPLPPQPPLPDTTQTLIGDSISQIAAIAAGAGISELHVETMPGKDGGEIRFQVSGVLRLRTLPN